MARAGVGVLTENGTGPEVGGLEKRKGRDARNGRVKKAERGGGVTGRHEELLGQAGGRRVAPAKGRRRGGRLKLLLKLLLLSIGD